MMRILPLSQIVKIILWILALGACLVSISVYFSLVPFWNLLPSDSKIRFAIDYTQPHASVLTALPYADVVSFTDDLQKLPRLRYLAYSSGENYQAVAVMPTISTYRLVRTQLRAEGWDIHQLGVLLYAQKLSLDTEPKDLPQIPSLTRAVSKTLGFFIAHPSQAFPLGLLEVKKGATPQANDNYDVGIYSRGNDVVGVIRTDRDSKKRALPSLLTMSGNDELYVSLPSHILSKFSQAQLNQWEPKVSDLFGFIKTHPSFIDELKKHESFTVIHSADSITLAVKGNTTAFIDAINGWLSLEDAYYRPRNQAFRLPDGGLGYEVVPGKARDVLSLLDEDRCHNSTGEGVKIWVCIDGMQASMSTNKTQALQVARNEFTAVFVAFHERKLKLIGIEKLDQVIVKNVDNQIKFTLDFQER